MPVRGLGVPWAGWALTTELAGFVLLGGAGVVLATSNP